MRMTWATQPAASEIVGIVPHASVEPVWLSWSRWPWHLQNPHFEIWDTPKSVVKVLTWSDDTIFIKAPNGCFLLLCRSSIRGRAIKFRAFQTDDCKINWASSRLGGSLLFSPVVKQDILSLHIFPLTAYLESSSPFWSRILCALQIFWGVSYSRRLFTSIFHAKHQTCFLWRLMKTRPRCTQRRSHSSHQQLNTSGGFSTLIHSNDRLLDIFTFTDHFKQSPPSWATDHMTGFKAILNDCFWGRIDFCHFTNYSLILSHMINNKMHFWLRFNSFSKHEDSSRPNGGSRQTNAFSKLTKKQINSLVFLKLEITGWSPLTCTLLHQRWLIGETGADLNVFSLWSVRNPSVGNCFGKH